MKAKVVQISDTRAKKESGSVNHRKRIRQDPLGEAAEPRTKVPDGIYRAMALDYKAHTFKGEKRLYLRLLIVEPVEFFEKEVYCVVALKKKYRPRSKFYQIFTLAHQRCPKPSEKLGPKNLVGYEYQIKTRTVKTNEYGHDHPECAQYSIADICNCFGKMDNSLPGRRLKTENP